METIPAVYWMIVFAFVAGFICFVLYELGMLLRDSRGIVVEAQETVSRANGVLSTVEETVYEVNDSIVGPIKRIGTILNVIGGFAEGLVSKRR